MTVGAFVHGWGFDARIWRHILALLPLKKTVCFDLGFFGQPYIPAWDDGQKYVLVTHSMGILWAAHYWPPNLRAVVAINGFPKFTCSDDFPHGIDPVFVRRMRQKMTLFPERVLADFYKRIQMPNLNPEQLSPIMLAEALDWLNIWDARNKIAEKNVPIRVLAAADDPLISMAHSRSFIDALPTIDLRFCESGGHILPITRPQWCVDNLIDLVS